MKIFKIFLKALKAIKIDTNKNNCYTSYHAHFKEEVVGKSTHTKKYQELCRKKVEEGLIPGADGKWIPIDPSKNSMHQDMLAGYKKNEGKPKKTTPRKNNQEIKHGRRRRHHRA